MRVARRVLLLGTGGTIGSGQPSDLRPVSGVAGVASAVTVSDVELRVEEMLALPSSAIGLAEMAQLHARIVRAGVEGYDAVVVSHGTDTLAETAFVLALLLAGGGPPVIVTGAARGPGQPGSDAITNLSDAVVVASRGKHLRGAVLVVFNGDVFSAVEVEKVSSTSAAAMQAPGAGRLGQVVEGALVLTALPLPLRNLQLDPLASRPVAIVGALPGDRGEVLGRCAQQHDGVVLVGMGGGHVPPQMMDAVRDLADGIPLVVTTGSPGAARLERTYAHAGSELDLRSAGAVVAPGLSPRKAALLLSLCLGQTSDRAEIASIFDSIYEQNG